WPGRKLVYRVGNFIEDLVQLDDEPMPASAAPLLQPAIRDGRIVIASPSLGEIQRQAAANLAALPRRYRALRDPGPYPVRRSDAIVALRERAGRLYGQAV